MSRTILYSTLVTRHTGRAVRLGIESRLAEYDRHVLTVVDFRDVRLIDFSCADEVVAKLVLESLRAGGRPFRFFFLRGMEEHHLDPIESALRRQALAVAAERADGRPVLLGAADATAARAWEEVCRRGRTGSGTVGEALGTGSEAARRLLDELFERRLLVRDEREYVSFGRLLAETDAAGAAS